MHKIFTVTVLLLLSLRLSAQQSGPVSERPAYFIYTAGERTDKKLKVLLISTYIYRAKNFSFPSDKISIGMSLDFSSTILQIERDEKLFPADYDNITFSAVKVNDLYGNYQQWNATHQYHDEVTQHDNSLSALEKIRVALINDYQKHGYRVYQVNFSPQTNGANQTSYSIYDEKAGTYRKTEFDNLEPLSPLWIPPFKKGDIKEQLARIGGSVSSSPGVLVIESTGKSQQNTSKSSKSTSSGSSSSTDPDKWKREADARMWEAAMLEAKGDTLYNMGTLFYMQALEQYNAAQRAFPSARVQAKIDNINALANFAKALNNGMKQVDEGVEKLDPHKKTRHAYFFVNYTGLLSSYSKIANPNDHAAKGVFLGVTGHRTFFSFEARLGYVVSPVYEYNVIDVEKRPAANTVRIQQNSAALGLSLGLNIPIRNVVIYGMYGFECMMTTGQKILTAGYHVDETPTYPYLLTKFTFGTTFRIPRTRIGIGVQYNLNSITGEDDGASAIIDEKAPAEHYYLYSTTNEKYKFNNGGISFCWSF
ncbi:hypothetical protein [Chitinophaga pinensis]|uniref:Outer membrane protein beta-barrel domain-containing protein n=1 Tax=Chitinophaga pinensis TaxID=79329 RepID=A0A5C6M2P3_9BACT|nr:hypothetical protein [Chitinophaga pinensis]TWW01996.1 hypothetical protein FEF09_02320 [Chitinophaga pinensis]